MYHQYKEKTRELQEKRGSYFEKNYYKPEIINKNGFFHFFVNKEPLQSYVTDFWDIFHDTYWGNPKF